MNKIIIGVVIILIILISLFFYLKNSCPDGKYYSISSFKCLTCSACPTNVLGIPTKWYDPSKSCKGFTDRICKDYSMPECPSGQRTILGTPISDRSCQPISDCYRECGPNKYAAGEHNCWSARGRTMSCNDCTVCDADEIDIAEENCSGRNNSNIDGFYSRIIRGLWVPMSCESNIDRVCLKQNYIKYNNNIVYSIIFNSPVVNTKNSLSTIPIDSVRYSTLYYNSVIPQQTITTINNNYAWETLSIINLNDSNVNILSTQWKIRPSNFDNEIYNNCPIESNDSIYFYKNFDSTHELILSVIKSSDTKYDIGVIRVPTNDRDLGQITGLRPNIYRHFRIENLVNFDRNILVSNEDITEKYFKLQLLDNRGRETGNYLGIQNIPDPEYNVVRIINENNILNENTVKINLKKY